VSVAKVDPFVAGGVDSRSAVAQQVRVASDTPGDYPRFASIPPAPTGLRPPQAWRTAVVSTWDVKRSTEAAAAQIPFGLANVEAWAATERGMIAADQATPPAADSADQVAATAAALQARATPPPPLK